MNSKEIKYPESGIVVENYISNNKKIIRWLKKLQSKEEIKKILNINLWIDKDFKTLESLITNFISFSSEQTNDNNSKFSIYINKNDEDTFLSDDDDTCGFHKY